MLIIIRSFLYTKIMRLAHKYNWHYAPPIYPEGDTQLHCQWCGFHATIKYRKHRTLEKQINEEDQREHTDRKTNV